VVLCIALFLLWLRRGWFHGDSAPDARHEKNTKEAFQEKSLKKNKKSSKVPRPEKKYKNMGTATKGEVNGADCCAEKKLKK
jgi:hypothetical protein